MPLSRQQKQDFHRDGFLVLRGAIAPRMIERTRAAINHDIGSNGLPPDELRKFAATSSCPTIRDQPIITDLFNHSPIHELCESLMGQGNVLPAKIAQIALRYPRINEDQPREFRGHLDGVGSDTNGVPKGTYIRNFTALAVVLLNDLPEPFRGNFTVWPGSHQTCADYFSSADRAEAIKAGRLEYDLPHPPIQITGKAGDVCLTHHNLWHGAAPNYSPDIRYAAIFRAMHKDVKTNDTQAMTDLWREWDGVREAMQDA
ncbi:MAG: phytanoyl-CoA dioxygenase family protein [Planctomycetota bacterium]